MLNFFLFTTEKRWLTFYQLIQTFQKQYLLIDVGELKQSAKTQNHSLAGNTLFIAVAFAQPEIGMRGFFCEAIFTDCLDVHTPKFRLNQLISKCLEVLTNGFF